MRRCAPRRPVEAAEHVLRPQAAKVIDHEIGAGDAFAAGLVVALAAGEDIADALRAAAAAAGASVLELGAGELDPRRAAELRGRVGVREVGRGAS